jgi:hypothetical protein
MTPEELARIMANAIANTDAYIYVHGELDNLRMEGRTDMIEAATTVLAALGMRPK